MSVYSEAMFIEQELGYNVMLDFMLRKRNGIQNKIPIIGPENENYWAFGDSYNKGAWVMHTLRHVINDDLIWWETLKAFAVENAKSNVNTQDFISHVESKIKINLKYFFDQYFYDHRVPILEYYQEEENLYYKWTDTVNNFSKPIDVEVNGTEKRIYPTKELQVETIKEFSVIHFRDWEFLYDKKMNANIVN